MAKRFGTVVVFKPGTTREQAEAALAKIVNVIDRDYYAGAFAAFGARGLPPVNEFEDEHGGPVWYIP